MNDMVMDAVQLNKLCRRRNGFLHRMCKSSKQVLIFLVLCSVGVILLYQWRVQVYVVQFFTWNRIYHNTTFLSDTGRSPHLATGHGSTVQTQRLQTAWERREHTTVTPRAVQTTPLEAHTCKDPFREEYIKKRNFLCCKSPGGLGNSLFIYASAYGIASRINRTLVISKNDTFYKMFNVRAHIVDDYECVVQDSELRNANIDSGYDRNMINIPTGDNYRVGVYLQSYKYFHHVREEIRRQFTFRKEQKDKANTIIDEALRTFNNRNNITDQSVKPVVVGVHVRRGDLVNNTYGYEVATPQYMKKAMTYFRFKYTTVLFLVCSNGMDWARKHVVGDDIIFVENTSYDVDLAVLVSCNHTLSTVGSFSWWAGYLAGGEVVYYQWPAREGSPLREHIRYDDYFLPSWIGMK